LCAFRAINPRAEATPAPKSSGSMTSLGQIADAVSAYYIHVAAEVQRARTDAAFAAELRTRWSAAHAAIETTHSPTGTPLPRLALPQTDEPGAIVEFRLGQGLP